MTKSKYHMKIWRRKWQPTPGFLPGKSHGQSRLQSTGLQRVQPKLATEHAHEVQCGTGNVDGSTQPASDKLENLRVPDRCQSVRIHTLSYLAQTP